MEFVTPILMQLRDKKLQVLEIPAHKFLLASFIRLKVVGLSSFIASSKQNGIVTAQLSVVPATKTCNELLGGQVDASLHSVTNKFDDYGYFSFFSRM